MNEQDVIDLKEAKDKLNDLTEILRLRNEEYRKTTFELQEEIDALDLNIFDKMKDISEQAKVEYSNTKNKKLFGGIGIQERTTIEYDNVLALKWAKEHNLCLTLDNSSFKKLAKTQDLDFVTKDIEIKVTFPAEIKV